MTWLGAHGKLLTTGFNKVSQCWWARTAALPGLRSCARQMREREGFIIDAKDISKPLSTISLGSGTGLLVPLYDCDTSLAFLTAKVIHLGTWPL